MWYQQRDDACHGCHSECVHPRGTCRSLPRYPCRSKACRTHQLSFAHRFPSSFWALERSLNQPWFWASHSCSKGWLGQSRENKEALGHLPVPKGGYKMDGEGLSTRTCNRTRRDSFELKEWRFRIDIRKKLFKIRVVKYWHSLVRELWTLWKCSRPSWMQLGATWSNGNCPCPWQGGGVRWSFRLLPTQNLLGFNKN